MQDLVNAEATFCRNGPVGISIIYPDWCSFSGSDTIVFDTICHSTTFHWRCWGLTFRSSALSHGGFPQDSSKIWGGLLYHLLIYQIYTLLFQVKISIQTIQNNIRRKQSIKADAGKTSPVKPARWAFLKGLVPSGRQKLTLDY